MRKIKKGSVFFMQSKNIKKILTIITAAGVILTTLGSASAINFKSEGEPKGEKMAEENGFENSNFFNESQEETFDTSQICSQEDMKEMINVLENFANVAESRKDVAQIIFNIAQKDCLKQYFKQSLSKIINILAKCAQDEDSQTLIVKTIISLALDDFFKECSENEFLGIFDLFSKCFYDDGAKELIPIAIKKLTEDGLMGKFSCKKISDIVVDLMEKCANSQNSSESVLVAISKMCEHNLFCRCSKEEILKIFELIARCMSYPGLKDKGFVLIGELIEKNLFSNFPKEEIFQAIEMFSRALDEKDGAENKFVKSNFIYDISKLIQNGMLSNSSNEEI